MKIFITVTVIVLIALFAGICETWKLQADVNETVTAAIINQNHFNDILVKQLRK